jgi:hypothetical protein
MASKVSEPAKAETMTLERDFRAGSVGGFGRVTFGSKDHGTGERSEPTPLDFPRILVTRIDPDESGDRRSYISVAFAARPKSFAFNIGPEDARLLATLLLAHAMAIELEEAREDEEAEEAEEGDDDAPDEPMDDETLKGKVVPKMAPEATRKYLEGKERGFGRPGVLADISNDERRYTVRAVDFANHSGEPGAGGVFLLKHEWEALDAMPESQFPLQVMFEHCKRDSVVIGLPIPGYQEA